MTADALPGETDGPRIHDLFRHRFSPLAFDDTVAVDAATAATLLEAARWAPSAGNSQPWAFHLVVRGTPGWEQVLAFLAPSSRRWAPSASVLVVNVAHLRIDDSDLDYSEFADYDLGQAVAHMTLQAEALGLAARQFRAFDREGLTDALGVRPGWAIRSMTAIGSPLSDRPERSRRRLEELRAEAFGTRDGS